MSEGRILASLAMDVLDFAAETPSIDEFIAIVSSCHSDSAFQVDVSYESIVNTENCLWKMEPLHLQLKRSDTSKANFVNLISRLYDTTDTDLSENFKHSLLLVLYQLINTSLMNKIAAHSEELVDLLLEYLGTNNLDWMDTILSVFLVEFSDMGFTPRQLTALYQHCYNLDKYAGIFYKLFNNENSLNNSVIFSHPDNAFELKKLSLSKSKSSFVISTWLKLTHSNNFFNSTTGSFKLLAINKGNGDCIITYSIENGRLNLRTDAEKQTFISFQLEINRLYNISFAHICEGKKKTRIDMFINGLLIETKVINNIFLNSGDSRSIFSYNQIEFSNTQYTLAVLGSSKLNNIVMEMTSIYVIESLDYLQWIIFLYMLGPTYSGAFTDTNLLHLIPTSKQVDLNILLNSHAEKLENVSFAQLQFKREDIVATWTSISNSKHPHRMKYKYSAGKKLVTGVIQNETIEIKRHTPLMDVFDSIGGFALCLRLIANSNSSDSLIQNLQFLFSILRHDKIIETNFVSNSGYEILSALLKLKKEYISIEILDAVLKYSGYNTVEPSESIVKNRMAYKSLVLNFDLWQCPDVSQNKIINKFLLFQFTVFVQESKFHQFNITQMEDMKITRRIILALKRDDFNEDILPVITNILWIIVRDNHSPEIVKLLLFHVIFSINAANNGKLNSVRQLIGGESVLEIIKNLVEEQPKILKAFNFNFLLSVLKGSSNMKKISLEFIIRIIGSSAKEYSNFVVLGGFFMLTDLLKSEWDNNDVLVQIFSASFKIEPVNPENLTINMIVFTLSENILNNLQSPHFLGLLNNLMKFAAFELNGDNAVAANSRLTNYIDMLIVLKRKSNFDEIYFRKQEWMGSLIFFTMLIKRSGNDILFQKYSKFLSEILVDRLYTDEKEENLGILEKLYGDYQIEFNSVVIPLLFDKLKSFQSLMIMIFNSTNKSITLSRILICYFQSFFDNQKDNSQYLTNFEILTLVIKKMFTASKSHPKLLPFLKVLIKEFLDSFVSILMFYIDNVAHLEQDDVNAKLTTCCQIFMSNPDIMSHCLNSSTFILLFSTFYKLLSAGEELQSLGVNCIRVLLLEKHNLEKVLDSIKISKKNKELFIDILNNTLTLDDESALKELSNNIEFVQFFDQFYKQNFDVFALSPLFHPGSQTIDYYITNKFKLDKSNKILEREIEPFNKIVFNAEMKNMNASTQDDVDDFYHYMSAYESLMGNLSYPVLDSHKILYPTEGKDRKRNKIISALSDKYMDFDKSFVKDEPHLEVSGNDISTELPINKLSIISKLQSGGDFDEDRNRRILRNLYVHDQIDVVHNVTQIIGLDTIESILVLGGNHIYIVEGYFYCGSGEICRSHEAPDKERDEVVKLLNGLTTFNQDGGNVPVDKLRFSKSKSWSVSNLVSVSKRKFLLRDVGFEIFFNNGSSILLTCISNSKRNSIFNKINLCISSKLEDPNLDEALKLASQQKIRTIKNDGKRNENGFNFVDSILLNSSDIASSTITSKWCNGEISNFQYLMLINTIAGRTFNDLTQYPVFPFVLSDYTSDTINLDDTSVYRDFSKPMGAQNHVREQQFRDRYEATKEMSADTPPFHYGTHYSSAMIVTSYLIRLHPFTESYLKLQGGKFDHPDRLFYSIAKLWNSASMDNTTDVRELIPEFYYLPEFLSNSNNIKFGNLQDGNTVNNVELPPWADNDPIKFVRVMRNALESDYVSEHLPDWIDLIFGYKQQGIEAVNATNVFHYLSYPGSIDIEKIHDDHERAVVISIIHNFGQTPLQIFKKKHPMKNPECYLNKVSIKDSFKMNFQNIIQSEIENKEKIQHTCQKNLKRLLYNPKNNKWISMSDKVHLFVQDNYMLKIEKEGVNGLCINDIHHFEQFTVGGYISCIHILSKERFIVGFNTGALRILEYSNDRYKYVTNAQRSIVKMESNVTINPKKKGIFQTFQNGNNSTKNSDFLLLNIGSLIGSHNKKIIKIGYLKNDRIIITLDSDRKWLTVWHEPNKFELENGEIFKMNEIKIDDHEIEGDDEIIDFQVCEDENSVCCITKKGKLIIWRINGGIIFNGDIDNGITKCEEIKLCENINDKDYNFGKLFIIKHRNENDDIKLHVFYISREFDEIEVIMELDSGNVEKFNKIQDIRMLNFKNGEFLVVLGTTDGIKFIK